MLELRDPQQELLVKSFAAEGPHEVRNGLLLRSDLHRLFDRGYVTVTDDLRIEVSGRLRQDYSNGHSYYPCTASRSSSH